MHVDEAIDPAASLHHATLKSTKGRVFQSGRTGCELDTSNTTGKKGMDIWNDPSPYFEVLSVHRKQTRVCQLTCRSDL